MQPTCNLFSRLQVGSMLIGSDCIPSSCLTCHNFHLTCSQLPPDCFLLSQPMLVSWTIPKYKVLSPDMFSESELFSDFFQTSCQFAFDGVTIWFMIRQVVPFFGWGMCFCVYVCEFLYVHVCFLIVFLVQFRHHVCLSYRYYFSLYLLDPYMHIVVGPSAFRYRLKLGQFGKVFVKFSARVHWPSSIKAQPCGQSRN